VVCTNIYSHLVRISYYTDQKFTKVFVWKITICTLLWSISWTKKIF